MLSPPEMYALNAACLAMEAAFGKECWGIYLVGSVMDGKRDFRDVDVRVIMDDETFAVRFPDVETGKEGHGNPWWALVCTSISKSLQQQTGLRIDFQIQSQTAANRDHGHKRRNPLGLRIGAFEP